MKVGDKVYFSPSGEFNSSQIWTIQDEDYSETLQCKTYNLCNNEDRHLFAYEDELMPVM